MLAMVGNDHGTSVRLAAGFVYPGAKALDIYLKGATAVGTKGSHGFTLVELLIVIVVIVILAAIGMAAYSGIQSRARATQASAALVQAKQKLELYKVDNGSYPTTGNVASAGVTNKDVSYQYTVMAILTVLPGQLVLLAIRLVIVTTQRLVAVPGMDREEWRRLPI